MRVDISLQQKAQNCISSGIVSGKIVPILNCEKCGYRNKRKTRRDVVAHHDDYHKPLEVRWLCLSCHKAWHRENGPAPGFDFSSMARALERWRHPGDYSSKYLDCLRTQILASGRYAGNRTQIKPSKILLEVLCLPVTKKRASR